MAFRGTGTYLQGGAPRGGLGPGAAGGRYIRNENVALPTIEPGSQRALQVQAQQDKMAETALTRLEDEKRQRVRGRASTLLTGTRGLTESPSIARRVLMGA